MSHDQINLTKQGQDMLVNVRSIVRDLPEVTEQIDGFGYTTFRVRNKTFIMMGGTVEKGPTLSIKASKEEQEFLLGQQGPYWKTPYIGQHGWVSTSANTPGCWSDLEPLIVEGYCLAAPKRLVRQVMDERLK